MELNDSIDMYDLQSEVQFEINLTGGVQGLQGNVGPQGIQGEKGPKGEQGIQGIQGPQGEKGETGSMPIFSIGLVQMGDKANASITGTDEHPILNFELPQGEKGETGNSGVYIGTEEPTDPDINVWINENGDKSTIPTKTSELTNDSGFINSIPSQYKTEDENNLLYQPLGDYPTSNQLSEVINLTLQEAKDYTDNEIATFDFIKIVQELPESGLINRTYFIPKTNSNNNDLYDEYMWINNNWEFVGTKQIEVDLTEYYKKAEVDARIEEHSIADYDSLPVGSILQYSNSTLPIGYLLCDGSLISRTDYSGLFNVIGTSYNLETDTDDTKFRLPNLKGRVPVGLDSEDTDFNTLGKTSGEKTHTLTIDEMPSHSHPVYAGSGDNYNIRTTINYTASTSHTHQSNPGLVAEAPAGSSDGIYKFQANPTGGNKPHNNLQPYIVLNYIIKASGTAVLKGNVVDNLTDNSTDNAPSQRAVNEALLDKYSTEEQRIGTWIDGKPIYRKTIIVTNDSTLTQITVQHNIQNLNEVTDVRGSIKTYTSWKPITNMYVPNVAEYGVAIYNITAKEKNFQILVGATLAREKAFTKAYVTLEYTKTTD